MKILRHLTVAGPAYAALQPDGSAREIARCNIGLRTADRVLITLAEFDADDFLRNMAAFAGMTAGCEYAVTFQRYTVG